MAGFISVDLLVDSLRRAGVCMPDRGGNFTTSSFQNAMPAKLSSAIKIEELLVDICPMEESEK